MHGSNPLVISKALRPCLRRHAVTRYNIEHLGGFPTLDEADCLVSPKPYQEDAEGQAKRDKMSRVGRTATGEVGPLSGKIGRGIITDNGGCFSGYYRKISIIRL